MATTLIKDYLLEWNINTERGKIILILNGEGPKAMEDIEFNLFVALAKVLEKGKAKFDTERNAIFNYNTTL